VYVILSELDRPIVVTTQESEKNTLVLTYDQEEQDIENRFVEIEKFNSQTFDVMSTGFNNG
jgi:predicted metal-dependent TIM-barrel fold hydrolase